jgi:hypothetical protein
MKFRGDVFRGPIRVLADTCGEMQLTSTTGVDNIWSGHLEVPWPAPFAIGDACQLVLDDGRSLDITIASFTVPPSDTKLAHFAVAGAFQ